MEGEAEGGREGGRGVTARMFSPLSLPSEEVDEAEGGKGMMIHRKHM